MKNDFLNISTKPFENPDTDTITEMQTPYQLIVWNDDINTFEWVIETLIKVCNHAPEQAEQSAMIVHFKGKCAVKNGDYDFLKPMCEAITERGIGATIESLVEN